MTTIVEYSGRLVDLAAYQGMEPGGERQLTMALVEATHGGKIVAGIQKLAQRFIILLCTEKGSVVHFPEKGCQFITDARTGVFQSPLDVFTSFSSSLVDIERQLKSIETADDPDDERFTAAEIESVNLSAGYASIRVALTSRAGNAFTFLQPITAGV